MAHISDAGDTVNVPLGYPTSLIYLDESGSKSTASRTFVVGAVKLREPGRLARAIRDVRDRYGFYGELKFSEATKSSVPIYYDLIDRLHESDAHLAACVVDGDVYNPFKGQPTWLAHAEVATQLLIGCINRRELTSVLLDGISTPRQCSLEDTVRSRVNKRLRATSVVAAACLDSRTNDTLQLADLVASAVFFERRTRGAAGAASPHSPKAKIASRLGAVFECPGFQDARSERVNIATYRGRGTPRPRLRVVDQRSRAS